MGTQGYLPRGGACVSCRRRKMVGNIALCIIWNDSSCSAIPFLNRNVMPPDQCVLNATAEDGPKIVNTSLDKSGRRFKF